MISGSKGEMWLALWILPFVLVGSLSTISMLVQSILLLKIFSNHCVLPYATDLIGGASILPGKRRGTATRSDKRCTNAW